MSTRQYVVAQCDDTSRLTQHPGPTHYLLASVDQKCEAKLRDATITYPQRIAPLYPTHGANLKTSAVWRGKSRDVCKPAPAGVGLVGKGATPFGDALRGGPVLGGRGWVIQRSDGCGADDSGWDGVCGVAYCCGDDGRLGDVRGAAGGGRWSLGRASISGLPRRSGSGLRSADDLLANNARYAESFDKGNLPLPP